QFYLLWPLLFVALFSLRPRWVTAVLGSLIAALAMWQLALVHGHASVDRVKFGPDTRSAVPLLVGCLSSTLLWFYVRPVRKVTTLLQPVALILVVALLATNSRPASPFHGGLLMVALACGCLLPVMVEEGTLLAKVLGNRPLVALGKISYSLYLWHVLCLVEISGFRFAKIVAIATAVVAAALSYRFVEQPFRKRRSLVPEARRTFRASPTPVEVPSR
ncbi:MAG TPA: acyltransferase, partial [Polyangiaceae bacterium]|nr:acyltransferase [Polyangiaceae bacterium]